MQIVLCLRFWLGQRHCSWPSQKRAYPSIFRSHDTIHISKNYFVIMFSVISFQFLTNKRYPNISYIIKQFDEKGGARSCCWRLSTQIKKQHVGLNVFIFYNLTSMEWVVTRLYGDGSITHLRQHENYAGPNS